MSTTNNIKNIEDIAENIEDIVKDINNFKHKSQLQQSRLWKNREHTFYDKKKNKKLNEIPEYTPIKKKYTNTEKILNIFPTKRVLELKIVLTLLAILIIVVLGIFFYMYLKSKKII